MGPRRTNLALLVVLVVAGSLPVAGPEPADPRRIPVTQWLDDRVQALDPGPWWRQPPFPLT